VLEVSVNKVGKNGYTTVALFSVDDEDPKAKPEFASAPDVKTSAAIRKALDYLDAEAASFMKG
jgi:hypothetical protein